MAGVGIVQFLAKWAVDRPRPNLAPWGFPSAHVLSLVVLCGYLAYVASIDRARPAWRRAAFGACAAIVGTVAYSRMYLEAHFLSDILGGFTAGLAYLCVSIWAISSAPPLEHVLSWWPLARGADALVPATAGLSVDPLDAPAPSGVDRVRDVRRRSRASPRRPAAARFSQCGRTPASPADGVGGNPWPRACLALGAAGFSPGGIPEPREPGARQATHPLRIPGSRGSRISRSRTSRPSWGGSSRTSPCRGPSTRARATNGTRPSASGTTSSTPPRSSLTAASRSSTSSGTSGSGPAIGIASSRAGSEPRGHRRLAERQALREHRGDGHQRDGVPARSRPRKGRVALLPELRSNREFWPNIPLPGLGYQWEPSDQLSAIITTGVLSLTYKPIETLTLSAL